MFLKTDNPRTFSVSKVDDRLFSWLEAFLPDRKSAGLADGSLRFYRQKLKLLADFCDAHAVQTIDQITPFFLRQYQLFLEESGHNPGGRHAAFRAMRTFFLWYENEVEPEGWSNPIRKVKAPKVPIEPLEPAPFETVAEMIKACPKGSFTGDRDKAILLCLLDTGARANEFLSMNLEDVNQARGDILIRQGKGRKPREVYLGKRSRSAIRKYLRDRSDNNPALWVIHLRFGSRRLTYDGLREVIYRLALDAEVKEPTLHDFRRAFALEMLRNGTDVYTLARLMGHEGITVLQRYLKQTYQDTEAAHRRAGPVDNADLTDIVFTHRHNKHAILNG